jgi:hypothetical protein
MKRRALTIEAGPESSPFAQERGHDVVQASG